MVLSQTNRLQRRRSLDRSYTPMTSLSIMSYRRVLYCAHLLLFATIVGRTQGSSPSAANSGAISPIRNWDSSWAASCAQGTVIAVSYTCSNKEPSNNESRDGLVLLMRSTQAPPPTCNTNTASPSRGSANKLAITLDGLRVHRTFMHTAIASDVSRRWTPIGTTAVCCMTGLASDVDFLVRSLQKHADTHQIIYEGSHAQPTLKVVRQLTSMLQAAVQGQGGRPYGVQALIVGQDTAATGTAGCALNVFTTDPSGGYRHWGSATAIGRGAAQVRKHLYVSVSKEIPASAKDALCAAMRASIKAGREAEVNVAADEFCAIVVQSAKGSSSTLRVATIDPEQVQELQEMLLKEKQVPEAKSTS